MNELSQIYEAIQSLDSAALSLQERLRCLREVNRLVESRLSNLEAANQRMSPARMFGPQK